MLTFEQLKGYYSGPLIASPKSMLVEYLQYELLDSLFKQPKSCFLSFSGGTAIRIVYNGSRFSEDLDFDNFGLSFEEFHELPDLIVEDMRLKGCTVEFRTVERNAYHCYVKFPHILQEARLGADAEEKILVRIDMMEKKKVFTPVTFTLNKFDIYRTILVNSADILLAQKFITIIGCQREKGRDFFDASYLYGLTQLNFGYLEETLGIDRAARIKKIFARCEELNFSDLAKDAEPFLMYPEQTARVTDFKQFIREKLS